VNVEAILKETDLFNGLYARSFAKAAKKQHIFDLADRWLQAAHAEPGGFDGPLMLQYFKLILAKCLNASDLAGKFATIDNLLSHVTYYKVTIAWYIWV
jgi:hypothetical protein